MREWKEDMREVLKEMRGSEGVKEEICKLREKVRGELSEQGMKMSRVMEELRREVREVRDRKVRW